MIRSITIGLPLGAQAPAQIDEQLAGLLRSARSVMAEAGLTPRTTRLTLPAVDAAGEVAGSILSSLRWVDELASAHGIRWFCLPLDFVAEGARRERLAAALDAIGRFPRMFLNMMIADEGRIAPAAAADAAGLVLKVARKANNGFDNFRVGASCNCPPNAPFFPFSRHAGGIMAFSFALETTGIALEATQNCGADLTLVRERVVAALVPKLQAINEIGLRLQQASGAEYRGLDASLAPFPDGKMSVAALIGRLGSPPGSAGSVMITALLTDALRAALLQSGAKAVGFNGVMFSLLEDERLARANNMRGLNLDALVSLAAVCGCGIDMVPLAGLVFQEEVAALMLDVAALSSTLRKPLGVRVLPIPGRGVNEFTQFNLDFLCDSRIMDIGAVERTPATARHLLQFQVPVADRS
ncbi:MAG: DUF711 family protein [Steroidobacteraceae bacterium]